MKLDVLNAIMWLFGVIVSVGIVFAVKESISIWWMRHVFAFATGWFFGGVLDRIAPLWREGA